MHLLRALREGTAERTLSELHGRTRRTAAPAGVTAGEISRLDEAGVQSRRLRAQG